MKPNPALAVASACWSLLACGGEPVNSATEMRESSVDDASTPSMPMGVGGEGNGGSATTLEGCELVEFESPPINIIVGRYLSIALDDPSYLEELAPFRGEDLLLVDGVIVPGPVDSLAGVECFTNLEDLEIAGGGAVTSLEPLRHLGLLTRVYLAGMQVEDPSPLSGKSALVRVALDDNLIQNLDGLVLIDSPAECPYALGLAGNPLTEADTRPFCEKNWAVSWGEGETYGECNSEAAVGCTRL